MAQSCQPRLRRQLATCWTRSRFRGGLSGLLVIDDLLKRFLAGVPEICDSVEVNGFERKRALQGVDKLYLLNAVVPDELTQGLIAFDLAKRATLQQIVYHSVFKAQAFKDVPHVASKLAIENALHEFDLPFTIIRPNYFYENDAAFKDTMVKTGVYPVPLGTVGVSAVDVRDIAEAAAIALTSNDHLGKTYNLVGPDILSGDKIASIWSTVLERRVRYGGHDMDAFEQQMQKTSPSWSAFDLRMMFQGFIERGYAAEDGDVGALTKLIGHHPRRYEDFAKEIAPASVS
jgi:uncharacterized protein YbjT (DUF2867 family)